MIVALIVARRAPALSSLAGCQEILFGAGGGRHPSEDMRGARRVAEARICRSLAYLTRPTRKQRPRPRNQNSSIRRSPQKSTSSDRVQVGRQGFVERSCRSDSATAPWEYPWKHTTARRGGSGKLRSMFSDLERKILAFPGPTGCRAKVPKSVVRGRRSQEIAVTARACGPNAPGLGPWVHGGEARRPPDGWTVHGERALKTPAWEKGSGCSLSLRKD